MEIYFTLKVTLKDYARQTGLHRAAFYGSYEAISFCLNFTDLKIYSKDSQDNTPLHFAAFNFHVSCIRFMIRHRAFEENSQIYLKIKNKKNESPVGIIIAHLKRLFESKNGMLKQEILEIDVLNYLYNEKIPEMFVKILSKVKEKSEMVSDNMYEY